MITQPYIYKLTLLEDTASHKAGMLYIGQHNGTCRSYVTSGITPNKIIKKYGKQIFKKEIIIQGDFNKTLIDEPPERLGEMIIMFLWLLSLGECIQEITGG